MENQVERQAEDGTYYKQVGKNQWSPVTREAEDGTIYKKVGEQQWTPLKAAQTQSTEAAQRSDQPSGSNGGYIRGALNTLPTIGMVAGGILGTPADIVSGPLGTVAGAGLGAAAGKALQNIGEKYLLGDEKSRSQIYLDPVKEGVGGATAEMGGQVLGKGLEAAANTPIVQKGMQKVGNGLAKVGELFSGTPEAEIKTYAKHADEIKSMAKNSDNSTAEAADQLRSKWAQKIQETRQNLNKMISDALKGNETRIDAKPVIDALEQSKQGIDADLYPEQINQIDNIITSVKTKVTPAGRMSIQDANAVKGFLQDKASSAYRMNGDIFNVGTEAAKGAKAGGATTRKLVNAAEPQIAQANKELANLHDLEDNMNLNLIREGKPEASILAAGSGGNARNAKALQELGEATGQDMLGDAQKLAAMRTFGSPKLMAQGSTGKTATHLLSGAGIGGLVGYEAGGKEGAIIGAGIGGALTSPMALRAAIDTGRIGVNHLQALAKSPAGRELMAKAGINLLSSDPATGQSTPSDQSTPAPRMTDAPKKGPDKWANDGFEKLIEHSSDLKDKRDIIFADPKLKELLIQASDLKPGTKAMEDIKTKIKSRVSKVQD